MVQTTLIPPISLVTNEHTFTGILDKTFNIWRDGSVYILSLKKWNLSDRVMQNLIFEKKIQSALIWPILRHFEKKMKVDLVPNLTFFQSAWISKCVVT